MLLNSHTLIRSFRELQYDLREFIEAVSRLCPVGSSVEGVIEIKWSDGSVSTAPVQTLIQNIVDGKFPKLDIGSASIRPAFDKDGIVLKIDSENGVSLLFDMLDADTLEIISSAIGHLVATESLVLKPGVTINSLDITGPVTSQIADIAVKTTVTNQFMVDNMVADSLDLSNVLAYTRERVNSGNIEQSSYVYAYGREPVFKDVLYVAGQVCFYPITPTGVQELFNNLEVKYRVPCKPYNNFLLWESETYSRQNVTFPTVFPAGSVANLVCIYPKKYVTLFDNDPNTYNVMVGDPSDDDANRIVRVCNYTGMPIKVCNAWKFSSKIKGSLPYGMVTPQSYVILPVRSSVDFIFDFERVADSLYAYMLPTASLE